MLLPSGIHVASCATTFDPRRNPTQPARTKEEAQPRRGRGHQCRRPVTSHHLLVSPFFRLWESVASAVATTTAGAPETTSGAGGKTAATAVTANSRASAPLSSPVATAAAGRSAKIVTGARKRYPRRASVSTNRGLSAESPNASRILLIAVSREWSKSTTVSLPHSRSCSSSRLTTSPGRSTNIASTLNGWLCNFTLCPAFQSSPVCRSASNSPNPTRKPLQPWTTT